MIILMQYVITISVVSFVSTADDPESLYNTIEESIAGTKSWKPPDANVEFHHYNDQCISQYPNNYDFVIVGAGSAGATLANRLSEIRQWNILLLEAGDEENDFNVIPAFSTYQLRTSKVWAFQTEPNEHLCTSQPGTRCHVVNGKGLGGSSAINEMIYSRGHRDQFDIWVSYGNPDWTYEDVLPYFKKAENIQFEGDANYRGHSGPLYVTQNKVMPSLVDRLINAGKENGFDEIDPNANQRTGIYKIQTTTYMGKRWSTNQAYISRARHRKNLTVLTKAFAIKILFDATKNVRELHFLYNNNTYCVQPKLELIVSAGAIFSAQLLLLSGIGPKKDLQSLGINVINDLPVGHHLGDLIVNFILGFATNYTQPSLNLNETLKAYTTDGSGPLGWPPTVAGQVFTPKLNGTEDKHFDVEITYVLPNHVVEQLDPSTLPKNSPSGQSIFAGAYIVLPKTHGKITLKSNKYIQYPLITADYVYTSNIQEIIYQGIEVIFNLMKTERMQEIEAISLDSLHPPCRNKTNGDLIQCILKYRIGTVFHPRGTCRMGANPNDTVVNHQLKVHGINKLRVVDSSVMPISNTAGLNSLTIMIAEKIADSIKKEHLNLHRLFSPV